MIVSGKARIAGVTGWPVSHSLSPRVHGFWLERYKIDGAYIPLPIAPDDFQDTVRIIPKLGFAGFNVTVPHKETIFDVVNEVDPAAARLRAVNTVVIDESGRLIGSNTDGYGFVQNLRSVGSWQADQGPVVVIGAGGASRAICAALADEGAPEIRLVNRTFERAEKLAEEIGGPILTWAWEDRDKALNEAALLANTTTLGMDGRPPLALSLDALPETALVTDIVYAPLETELLARARRRGNRVVDGLGMLLHQARPGFAAWFGVEPEVDDDLRTFVLNQSGS